MTIIYQYRVATTSLGGFLKLLQAWRGSVYKLMYKELIIFVTLYALVSLVYRVALAEQQKRQFESLVMDLRSVSTAIPISFVLAFYVSIIVQRWWQQFTNVPWPDRTLFIMCTYLHGSDDRDRIIRRTVARYMLFGMIVICRSVSVAVMKRFPTIDHIVEAGFITKDEAVAYEGVQCQYLKFWVPLMWANNVLVTARQENKISSDFGLRMIIQQLADFRDKCSLCFVYDWITVPLVYTQVVTFGVYSYFAVSLVGQQYLDTGQKYEGYEHDWFVPGFTIIQFLFYMGWLKVAEQMINPFGEDDDDYDINWLIDRHTAVAFALVDQCSGVHPLLMRDAFWNDLSPDVPYTESSLGSVRPNFLGSTFNVARPSIDVERLLHEEDFHAVWGGNRSKNGSISGSLLSLLPFRALRSHDNAADAQSAGSQGTRFLGVPQQGKQLYQALGARGRRCTGYERVGNPQGGTKVGQDGRQTSDGRRLSDHTPYRSRTLNEYDAKESEERERKLSLPFNVHLSVRNRQRTLEKSPTESPKLSRFTVEPVMEEEQTETEPEKTRRSGNVNTYSPNNGVSRVPILSAIEEGNSVTSMEQMFAQKPAPLPELVELRDIPELDNESTGSTDDVFSSSTAEQTKVGNKSPDEKDNHDPRPLNSVTSPLLQPCSLETEVKGGGTGLKTQQPDIPKTPNRRRIALPHIGLEKV